MAIPEENAKRYQPARNVPETGPNIATSSANTFQEVFNEFESAATFACRRARYKVAGVLFWRLEFGGLSTSTSSQKASRHNVVPYETQGQGGQEQEGADRELR